MTLRFCKARGPDNQRCTLMCAQRPRTRTSAQRRLGTVGHLLCSHPCPAPLCGRLSCRGVCASAGCAKTEAATGGALGGTEGPARKGGQTRGRGPLQAWHGIKVSVANRWTVRKLGCRAGKRGRVTLHRRSGQQKPDSSSDKERGGPRTFIRFGKRRGRNGCVGGWGSRGRDGRGNSTEVQGEGGGWA